LLIIPMQVFFVLGSRAGSLALSATIALHVLLHANLKYMMELMSCEPFVNDLFFEAEGCTLPARGCVSLRVCRC
jgi:hypothetical protein